LAVATPSATSAPGALFAELDAMVEAAMAQRHIPGVAVGVLYQGEEYVRGYGVTNVDSPQPVDGDTLFRIGSITKTFTGTAVMRLVERGLLELEAPVRRYLPALQLADESVAARVTVRQLLNHSAGWLGDDYADFGRGDDAQALYAETMWQLPQLTPLGEVFAYNNAAADLAGYLVAAVTGSVYEDALEDLVLGPLGLDHSGFFTDELIGYTIAASHDVQGDRAVVDRAIWPIPRSLHATGGIISSVRDQLRYARFHLGEVAGTDGDPILSPDTLALMRSDPGPGGTLVFEIDGVCVSWWQRRTAEGVPVFQHGGAWYGQNSDLLFVPEQDFAMVILTNSVNGPLLLNDISYSGWALERFAGLSNPPAVPHDLEPAQLAEYEGEYVNLLIPTDRGAAMLAAQESPEDATATPAAGASAVFEADPIEIHVDGGGLRVRGALDLTLTFYRDDYALTTDADGVVSRSDFLRGPDGRIAWYRNRGRLYRRQD
ncbi:MAG: serine hydrolase domain-containing protein, partial [Thermomicrobiales bacterium]